MSVPDFMQIAIFVKKLLRGPNISKLGHVHQGTPTLGSLYIPFAGGGLSCIGVPNLMRIAQFVQKLLTGSQNLEITSRDPGHAHLGVVL